MKVLVVTANFLVGGLERSIIKQVNYLESRGHTVFLAVRNLNSESPFIKNRKIIFLPEKMFDSAEKIINLILEKKIDVIHAHPFNTILCSIFASQITQVPMIYSVHGLSSLNYTHRKEDDVLIRYFLGEVQPDVISVSKYYSKFLKEAYFNDHVHYLPNCIDMESIPKDNSNNTGDYVFIGRLSKENVASLKLLFEKKENYGLNHVDVYGHGEKLAYFLSLRDNAKGFFSYKGICEYPLETISYYDGVIGIGQQVLEGIASKKPVILIGYGKVSGYMNYEIYEKIKNYNFVNRFLKEKESYSISKSDIYKIYSDCFKNFNSNSINELYEKILEEANFINNDYLKEIYHLRYTDDLINLCKKKILPNTLNPYILNALKWLNTQNM